MKKISIVFVFFAWLVITNQTESVVDGGDGKYTINPITYCVPDKPAVSSNGDLVIRDKNVYIRIGKNYILQEVTSCPVK